MLRRMIISSGKLSEIFSPADLNPELWIKGDAISDISGNAHSITNNGGVTVESAVLNGEDVLRFDNVNGGLQINSVASSFDGADTPFTFAVVIKIDAAAGGAGTDDIIYMAGTSSGSAIMKGQYLDTTTDIKTVRRDDVSSTVSGATFTMGSSAFKVLIFSFSGTQMRTFVDGVEEIDESMDVGTLTCNRFAIGEDARAAETEYFDGDMAEIVYVSGTEISDGDRGLLDTYFNDKFGL